LIRSTAHHNRSEQKSGQEIAFAAGFRTPGEAASLHCNGQYDLAALRRIGSSAGDFATSESASTQQVRPDAGPAPASIPQTSIWHGLPPIVRMRANGPTLIPIPESHRKRFIANQPPPPRPFHFLQIVPLDKTRSRNLAENFLNVFNHFRNFQAAIAMLTPYTWN